MSYQDVSFDPMEVTRLSVGLQATVVIVKWLTIILLYKVGATMKSELKGVS